MQAVGFQKVDVKAELEKFFMFKMMCKLEPCMTNELDRASTCKNNYFSHKPSARNHWNYVSAQLYNKFSADFLQNMEINKQ